MKTAKVFLLLLAFSTCGLAHGQCAAPNVNGLYVADSPDNAEYKSYLRFFEDGTVLIADSKSPFEEVSQWMEKERPTITETEYELNKKCRLKYEIEINERKVVYESEITDPNNLVITRTIKGGGETLFNYTFTAVDFNE